MQLFGVGSNSVLDRACPIPYSLIDTTFSNSQWLTDSWPMKIQDMGSMAHHMFVNIYERSMADTSAKQPNKVEREWMAEEVETLIHLYENEPMLWDISHSDYSKKDVRQKVLAKIEETLGNKFTSKCVSSFYFRVQPSNTVKQLKLYIFIQE